MANTYSQLYIQIVFAVKGRQNLISSNKKDEIYKYISGIIANQKQKLIAINGMPDHIHILVGIKPDVSLSDLVRVIKTNSSKFINEQRWINGKFEWQTGFGAFSYGHSQLTNVIKYIENQEEHHKTKTFREEYIAFLKLFNIDFKNEYLFDDVNLK
ncbi:MULTISPECIES: IS200/IS605 family transposase [unclassified Flavobacterium]|jgi:putative transposase|uniref:IS200/IS605 family transposase n=1 Tax=unclassified Flavobacterium TaxID=196869 RepID=UPI000709A331|nr:MULTISPECIES: IS200/IS605 family transposase [unclassified Flavobacterium]KRD62813.1 transposase [Flavobacterium sp. Root935]TDX13424.1 REP element-mobilizing transposase RayT [Flavobacterium sp. S87F.05.LMB.W.Kidney.N]BDU24082.1 transposase [Flavobacterium sp. GSB-24]